jgi:hypothetical protein
MILSRMGRWYEGPSIAEEEAATPVVEKPVDEEPPRAVASEPLVLEGEESGDSVPESADPAPLDADEPTSEDPAPTPGSVADPVDSNPERRLDGDPDRPRTLSSRRSSPSPSDSRRVLDGPGRDARGRYRGGSHSVGPRTLQLGMQSPSPGLSVGGALLPPRHGMSPDDAGPWIWLLR